MDPILVNTCGHDRYCQVVNESAGASVVITSHCRGRFQRKIQIDVICQGAGASEVKAGITIIVSIRLLIVVVLIQ